MRNGPPLVIERWNWEMAEHNGHPAPTCVYCGCAMPSCEMQTHEDECQRPTSPPAPIPRPPGFIAPEPIHFISTEHSPRSDGSLWAFLTGWLMGEL